VPGCAIARFESAADYAANLRELGAVIEPVQPGLFGANLTRIELPLIRLIDAQEQTARDGFLSIPRDWRYAFYTIRSDLPLLLNEELLSPNEILLAGDGERLRQRTIGAAHFGAIGIQCQTLDHYAEGLADGLPAIPVKTSVIKLQSGLLRRLLQLHGRVVRTAASRPGTVCHRETARSIEQELIEVLVTCLLNSNQSPASLHAI
jgi:hypothetical protein